MIIVIIAGGQGTRLWPLSKPNYPKHLLKLTNNSSLLQNTYKRVRSLSKEIYVVTEKSHAKEVERQLPLGNDHIIVEPGRRGTASCILLALKKIAETNHKNQTIVFLHADHHIENQRGFVRTVRSVDKASATNKQISLIGIKPNYPATGFGYIKLGKYIASYNKIKAYQISKFVEKPDFATAKRYLKNNGYLWNLGLFAASLSTFEDNFQKHSLSLFRDYQKLLNCRTKKETEKAYLKLKTQPIDIALIEKVKKAIVLLGEFDWADVGSFTDLHKILKGKKSNSLKGRVSLIECDDCIVHGSTKPIIAIGLSGMVVIDTPEGLLVCPKEKSQQVGEVIKKHTKKH